MYLCCKIFTPVLGPTQPPVQWVPVFLWGVKWPWHDDAHLQLAPSLRITGPIYLLPNTPSCSGQIIFFLFLNINQLDALNFIISLFQASTCFEHICSSSGGQKLHYTVSGIITPIGGRPVHNFAVLKVRITQLHTHQVIGGRQKIQV